MNRAMKHSLCLIFSCFFVTHSAPADVWYQMDASSKKWLFYASEVLPSIQEKVGKWKPLALYSIQSDAIYISIVSMRRKDNLLTAVTAFTDSAGNRQQVTFADYNKGPDGDVDAVVKNGGDRISIMVDGSDDTGSLFMVRLAESLERLKSTTSLYIGSPFWKWDRAGTKLLSPSMGE